MNIYTEREIEVAAGVACGLRNDEIAARLTISENTVRFHLEEIYSKLGTSSRALLAVSYTRGEIGPNPFTGGMNGANYLHR